jgi:hypothetical protein
MAGKIVVELYDMIRTALYAAPAISSLKSEARDKAVRRRVG